MKLNHTELHQYINKAWADWYEVNKDPRAKYRFGQSLWKVLPKEVTEPLHGTVNDFFYWSDDCLEDILEIVYDELTDTQ